MSKAKEMFRELGYTFSEAFEVITYQLWLSQVWCSDITFNTKAKIISIVDFINIEDNNGCLIGKDYVGSVIDRSTLKAINQQAKELGWFDE